MRIERALLMQCRAGATGTEDQFVYMDDNGNYHAVFHHSKLLVHGVV